MLAKSVDKYGHDWDVHLPHLLFVYRVAIQYSTRASPFYLLYGREPMLPTERGLTQPKSMYQVDFADYSDELVAHLSDAWVTAEEHIQTAQKKKKVSV